MPLTLSETIQTHANWVGSKDTSGQLSPPLLLITQTHDLCLCSVIAITVRPLPFRGIPLSPLRNRNFRGSADQKCSSGDALSSLEPPGSGWYTHVSDVPVCRVIGGTEDQRHRTIRATQAQVGERVFELGWKATLSFGFTQASTQSITRSLLFNQSSHGDALLGIHLVYVYILVLNPSYHT